MNASISPYKSACEALAKVKTAKQYCRLFNKLAKLTLQVPQINLTSDRENLTALLEQSAKKQDLYAQNLPEHSHKRHIQMARMISETNRALQATVLKGQVISIKNITGFLDNIANHMMQSYMFTDVEHPLKQAGHSLLIIAQQKYSDKNEKHADLPVLGQLIEKAYNNMYIYMFDPGFQMKTTQYDQLERDFDAITHLYDAANISEIPMDQAQIKKNMQFLDTMRLQAPQENYAALHSLAFNLRQIDHRQTQIHADTLQHRQSIKQTVRKLKR